jgi:hypothetical protein
MEELTPFQWVVAVIIVLGLVSAVLDGCAGRVHEHVETVSE